jgi:hypothetical protein
MNDLAKARVLTSPSDEDRPQLLSERASRRSGTARPGHAYLDNSTVSWPMSLAPGTADHRLRRAARDQ